MRKIISIILCILMVASFAACQNTDKPITPGTDSPTVTTTPTNPTHEGTAPKDGIIKGSGSGSNGTGAYFGDVPDGGIMYEVAPSGREGAVAKSDSIRPWTGEGDQTIYKAGTLTGAEQQDTFDIEKWLDYFKKGQDESSWKTSLEERGFYGQNAVVVELANQGAAICNAKLQMLDSDKNVISEAITDIFGRAVLYVPAENMPKNVSITANGVNVIPNMDPSARHLVVSDGDYVSKDTKALDLMFMIDTTGSMGDELRYIQEELVNVVNRVAASGETFSIRVSVNFYRDETDEYVVKYYDFRDAVEEMANLIKTEHSEGGGDFPEAVHKALENIIDHEWREDAIKLCFLVLDAPPHTESEVQGVNASLRKSINEMMQKGIKLIPVVASGIDKDTEYLLRTFAVLTNGTYIFLTDDSGIGNSHETPDLEDWTVEPLNECLIRVICKFCGLEYKAPEKQEQQSTDTEPTPATEPITYEDETEPVSEPDETTGAETVLNGETTAA